jgi:hypothetical protein
MYGIVTENLSNLFQINWITYLRDTGTGILVLENDKGRTRRSDKQYGCVYCLGDVGNMGTFMPYVGG